MFAITGETLGAHTRLQLNTTSVLKTFIITGTVNNVDFTVTINVRELCAR